MGKNRYAVFLTIDGRSVRVISKRQKDGMISCKSCKKYLPVDMFYVSWHTREQHYQLTAYCKKCNTIENERNSRKKATINVVYFLRRLERSAKCNAKHRGIEYSISRSWWEKQLDKQKGLCFYTGKKMTHDGMSKSNTNISIDRIDSSKGYTPDNCVLCCLAMNVKLKNDLTLYELYDFAKSYVIKFEEELGVNDLLTLQEK